MRANGKLADVNALVNAASGMSRVAATKKPAIQVLLEQLRDHWSRAWNSRAGSMI